MRPALFARTGYYQPKTLPTQHFCASVAQHSMETGKRYLINVIQKSPSNFCWDLNRSQLSEPGASRNKFSLLIGEAF
jgi:hypothetical protein